jgi:hypothetical protein
MVSRVQTAVPKTCVTTGLEKVLDQGHDRASCLPKPMGYQTKAISLAGMIKLDLAVNLVIAASIGLCGFTVYGQESKKVPDYCGTSGLTEEQKNNCFESTKASEVEMIGKVKMEEVKYPYTVRFLALRDDYNLSKPAEVHLVAENKSGIRIQFHKDEKYLDIPGSSITTWGTSDTVTQDATGAISTVVAGALFFPPMILAAPFMTSQIKTNHYQVQYLDEYARAKTLYLSATMFHKEILSILRFTSGLKPTEKRSDQELAALRKAALERLVAERESVAIRLLNINQRKPWCQFIDPKKDEQMAKSLTRLNSEVASVSKALAQPEPKLSLDSSIDEQWEKYLDGKQGIREWVKKFPDQGAKMKKCPEIS